MRETCSAAKTKAAMKRMKTLFTIVFLLIASAAAFAQAPTGLQSPPTAADLENQMEQIGCKAERSAAAQTIVNLQKQVADLQKQLNTKDPPPKSGATKH
jgi:hypothetical protein